MEVSSEYAVEAEGLVKAVSAPVAGLDVVADATALRSQIGLAGRYAAVDENLTGAENR